MVLGSASMQLKYRLHTALPPLHELNVNCAVLSPVADLDY